MKYGIIIAALSLLPTVSAAAVPDTRSLAIEYLRLSHVEESINESLNATEGLVLGNLPAEERARIHRMMQESAGWDATKDQLTEMVARIFTADELRAYVEFMKTPLGASGAAKSGEFSRQFSELVAANMQRAIQKLQSDSASRP